MSDEWSFQNTPFCRCVISKIQFSQTYKQFSSVEPFHICLNIFVCGSFPHWYLKIFLPVAHFNTLIFTFLLQCIFTFVERNCLWYICDILFCTLSVTDFFSAIKICIIIFKCYAICKNCLHTYIYRTFRHIKIYHVP